MTIQRNDLAIYKHIGKRFCFLGDSSEFFGPVETLAGIQRDVTVTDPQLHAVAVKLDLMAPAIRIGRPFDGGTKLRRDEIRHSRDLLRFGGLRGNHRRLRRQSLAQGARLGGRAAVRMPDRVGFGFVAFGQHERLWRLSPALGDLRHRSPRGDRAIRIKDVVGVACPGEFVAVLDQEPVGALAAVTVALHPHQHPAAVQFLAVQVEFQVALGEAAIGVIGFPGAAVPELHGAAAILIVGNGAFEITVIERMVLDLDRKPLVVRIERGPARHRPGFEDAVKLQPEIVMQSRRRMLLDHESPVF